jgi:pyrroloquinoline quinone (PQQ) biosynthesis protein C
MRRAAERLMAAGKQAAATHCLQVAEEESGHDTLVLLDLEALGLPGQNFVARLQLKTSLALVELFAGYADSEQPIAVLGYAYALERAALFATEASIDAIEQLIPVGINATRCLRVHSSVGSDAGHVAESIAFIATLPPQDRATIVRGVYQTIRLQNTSASDYPGDEAMQSLLDEFGWTG